jgi:hypothetical protein
VTKLAWDVVGSKTYETGVSKGVLYIPDVSGNYVNGYAWSGLTKVTEKPTGAGVTPLYADNTKYLNLVATEYFGCDIAAYTYPDEFEQCDGTVAPEPGVLIGQQGRTTFGFSYQTKVGTDLNTDAGYKIHLVWGCLAAPSQKDYGTVNDNPSAIEFSWSVSCTPVNVTGLKPTSTITIDSTKVDATALAALELVLYGDTGVDPRLPGPDEVLAMFSGTVVVATPTAPTYNGTTHLVTIPTITGVQYYRDGVAVSTDQTITVNTVFTALPKAGYKFPLEIANEWLITY